MIIKPGASIAGLDIRMRPALIAADKLWKDYGILDGVCITSGLDGCHSAGSLHYYGLAVDMRINYFSRDIATRVKNKLYAELCAIDVAFDVVMEPDHIHVEYDVTKKPKPYIDRWLKK